MKFFITPSSKILLATDYIYIIYSITLKFVKKTIVPDFTDAFSRKTPKTSNKGLGSKAEKILWVINISWFLQESFDLNPDWLLLKWLFCFTKLKISSKMSFSRKIEHIGKNKTATIIDYSSIYWLFCIPLEWYQSISNYEILKST